MAAILPILVGLVAVLAGLWQVPVHFGNPSASSYGGASTASNQGLLRHMGNAQDAQFNFITNWLARPPGARFHIGKPSAKDVGAVPVIKLKVCKFPCTRTKFPEVVSSKCASCLALLSLPTWSHGGGDDKPDPPLARLPVYESGFTALASIPLLYPRRWLSADFLHVGAGVICCKWLLVW